MPLPATSTLVRMAAGAYAANCALGAAVATRVLDTSAHRWVHHALFVLTATSTVAAVVVGLGRRSPSAVALAPALVPLAAIPYAGTARHVRVALAAAPWFASALVVSEGA